MCIRDSIITGLSGRDTFIYSSLGDSVLLDPLTRQMSVDHITDYEIGNDIIKGPNRVESGEIAHISADMNAEDLNQRLINELMAETPLQGNGAALLTTTSDNRTFVLMNDSNAGFNSALDGMIEITGYSGEINNFEIL